MTYRKYLPVAAAALLLPALAFGAGTFESQNTEIGVATHAAPSTMTREQVRQELAQWKRQPQAGDGWVAVQGEQGWQAPQAGTAPASQHRANVARAGHEHWRAVSGEAGWVGLFGG